MILAERDTARLRRLWEEVGCQRLDAGLATIVLEAAVDYGPEKAKEWLRESQLTNDPLETIALFIEQEARTWQN